MLHSLLLEVDILLGFCQYLAMEQSRTICLCNFTHSPPKSIEMTLLEGDGGGTCIGVHVNVEHLLAFFR